MSLLGEFVALADSLTSELGLQATITHEPFLYADGAGKRYYAAAVTRRALLTTKQKMVRTFAGSMEVSTAQLAFLDPTPVNVFDRITLPGGVEQSILATEAFADDTQAAILTEIFLGDQAIQ